MRTKPRLIILWIFFVVTAGTLGTLFFQGQWSSRFLPMPGTDNVVASSSSVFSSSESGDEWGDPEREGTPAYKAAERESLENVQRVKTIAEGFVYKRIPVDYEEFCPPDAGFCFSYPRSWGKATWYVEQECIGRPDLIGFSGIFFDTGDDDYSYYFGASAYSYVSPLRKCVTDGRGLGHTDGLPQVDPSSADKVILNDKGESIAVWYGIERGWLTHKYNMAFTAPTSHPLVTRIAFIGPESSSPTLIKEEIEAFLIVVHSFRTMDITKTE